MSMTINVADRYMTSPCSNPKPESMYREKTARNRSMTDRSFIATSMPVEAHRLRRVLRAVADEACAYLFGLRFVRRSACFVQRRRAALRHGELLRLDGLACDQREQLVRRLAGLQCTDGALALRHQVAQHALVGEQVLRCLRLHPRRGPQRLHRGPPARLRVLHHLCVGSIGAVGRWIQPVECRLRLRDVEG